MRKKKTNNVYFPNLPTVESKQTPEVKHTALGRHLIEQNFDMPEQLTLFSNIEEAGAEYSRKYGVNILKNVKQIGLNLNDFQFKVLEGIAKLFKHSTDNGYTGNIKPKTTDELIDTKFSKGYLPPVYKNIKSIPIARATQTDLIKSTGVNENSRGEKERALETLEYLCTEPIFYSYKRLVKDNKGKPVMDEGGKYKMEDVNGVDTLFSLKIVKDEITQLFKYYEIEPTGIFLDQAESYFLLIPETWREEISKALGGKEVSKYTMKFILWLVNEYEKRRSRRFKKDKEQYIVKMSWEEIAKSLKMPESLYKRNRPRAEKMINRAIEEAIKTGYLLSWEIVGYVNVMKFNPEKYYKPKRELIS